MDVVDTKRAWQNIPPEEKFLLMAQSHAKGVIAAVCIAVVGGTLAVGLGVEWIFWGSLFVSMFAYQFAAGKAFRGLKPQLILSYLGARSAARRYAYTAQASNLALEMVFRGFMAPVFKDEELLEALDAQAENTMNTPIWITLFSDTIVAISEERGGAKLEFSFPIDTDLTIQSSSADGKDYSNHKEIILTCKESERFTRSVKLTSDFPAALVVFEKKIQQLRARQILLAKERLGELPEGLLTEG